MAIIAAARHGAHVNNVLTEKGIRECEVAAAYLAGKKDELGFMKVVLATSQEPRAVESGKVYLRVLVEAGIEVVTLNPITDLNPAKGLGAIAKGNEQQGIPAYGEGLIRWWRNLHEDNRPDTLERYGDVARRVDNVLNGLITLDEEAGELVLAVFHGGAIEPGLGRFLVGAEIPDLPSGALVIADDEEDIDACFSIFDPASKL